MARAKKQTSADAATDAAPDAAAPAAAGPAAGAPTAGDGALRATAPLGDVLPAWIDQAPALGWLRRLTGEQRVALGLSLLAALLMFPWVGATGFWDPWEVHYGEVAREMIARGDYLHPWWESSYFFSKPALDMWLMAAGMLAAGTNDPARGTGLMTEWGVRLPWAAISAVGALLLFVAASRLVGRRPAILATVAILTAPLMTLISRQAVPDPIFVSLLTASMSCLLIVLFEREDLGPVRSGRGGWVVALYALIGLATLAKGLLGFALPGAVVLVYCAVTGEWYRLRRLRLLTGALIVVAICAPWYGHMFAFEGRDDEGKNFFERFILHDHFRRLTAGVHQTTGAGTFVYYIEQLGFDCFPWVVAFPGALAVASKLTVRPQTARQRALLFTLLWAMVGFAVFAFSATKFHQYAFPVVPPLLLFCGVWLDQLLDEGLRPHAGELFVGGLLYGLIAHNFAMVPKHITDMFVYQQERAYPHREIDPRPTFTLLFFAAPAVALSPWVFDRAAQLWTALRRLSSKAGRPEARAALVARMSGAPLATPESRQDRALLVLSLIGLSICFSIFLGWFHWRALSHHWTQRDLIWAYYQDSSADEPLAAYQMNWRGETFYSRNTVRQIGRGAQPQTTLHEFLQSPGKRKWILVEQGRLGNLRQAVGANYRLRVVESKHNKFALTVVEGAPPPPPMTPPPGGTSSAPPPQTPQKPAPPPAQGAPQPAQPPQQIGPMN